MKTQWFKRSNFLILTSALILSAAITRVPSVQAAPEPPSFGPLVMRWFIGLGTGLDPSQMAVEMQVVSDFNKSQNQITLVAEFVPNSEARDTLANEIASGSAPDIVGPVGWFGANAFHGQWLDLAPLITSTGFDTSIFDPALMGMYNTDEGQVGLPFAMYPSAIYYNPALFDAAGLHYPPAQYGDQYEMPDHSMVDWSWDTVTQVAKLLTLDNSGKNSTQTEFDHNNIVQYGFSFGWEAHPNYWGSFWQGGSLVQGTGPYTAVVPDAWKAAWQWVYNGMWGDQSYIPNGAVSGSADFDSGNVFASGKIAMLDNPSWYLCCLGDLTKADGTFQFGAMPTYNGAVGGRIDADTFRIWKDTPHPDQAFEVLSYLVTTGVDKLIVGTPDIPAPYGAVPAITDKQQPFLDSKAAQFPFVTQDSWDVMMDGLNYPDVPSAEGFMPNINEAWARIQSFGDLLNNNPGLSLSAEETILEADLAAIFNGLPVPIHPYIEVSPNSHWIHGRAWPTGTEVTLTIQPGDYTDTAVVEHNPNNPGDPNDFLADFDWPGMGVQAGYTLTMTGAGVTKTLIVSSLQVTSADALTDTVSGTAPAGAQVQVCVNIPGNCAMRYVTADGSGLWLANYTSQVDLQPGSNGWAAQYDDDRDRTWYDWRVLNPYIEASPNSRWVHGRDWPIDTELTLTIQPGDYTDTGVVQHNPNNPGDPNDIAAFFENLSFELQSGQTITLEGGGITKTYTIQSLQVNTFDLDADTVSGTGVPGHVLQVCANVPGNCVSRYVTVEGDGNWTADYHNPGSQPDEHETVNIQNGTNGWVADRDEDGDQTWYDWRVSNPCFADRANDDQVEGFEWMQGEDVTLEIDDPNTQQNPDYTATQTVGLASWDPSQTYVNFNLRGIVDIQVGYIVSMSNGVTTKTHTVTGLAFTSVDIDNDLVHGVADPNVLVNVWACDWANCYNRHAITDGDGNWSVDFTQPGSEGNEQVIFNIVNGTWIDSEQLDDDGDRTRFGMTVSLPTIEASVGSHWVHARGNWPDDTLITMNIDDPNLEGPVDYTADATFGQNPGNPDDPNDRLADFDLDDFDLQAGQTITMEGGSITKTYTIQSLDLTAYDLAADTLSGTGNAGHQLQVCVNMPGYCVSRHITVDGSGNWVTDYHNPGARSDEQETVDLQVGSNGWVADYEDDGDQTWYDWNYVNEAPTNIALSNNKVSENRPSGTAVGTLSTTDPDAGEIFTYSLTSATGCSGVNNASFQISGSSLKTKAVFNYEAKHSYIVCIQTNDGHGGTFKKQFTITVTDLPETFTSTGSLDGWVLESTETSSVGGTMNASATTFYLGDDASDRQYRSILSFDTSALPNTAVITKVTLKIKYQGLVGTNPFTTHGNILVDIKKGYFSTSNSLQTGDFQATASKTAAGTITNSSSGGWYSVSFGSSTFTYVNKAGLTQFRLRFSKDDNDDRGADCLKFYSGNYVTSSYRPILLIEYTVP